MQAELGKREERGSVCACVLVCFCSAEGARGPCGAPGEAGFVALVELCARALWGHLEQQGAGDGQGP